MTCYRRPPIEGENFNKNQLSAPISPAFTTIGRIPSHNKRMETGGIISLFFFLSFLKKERQKDRKREIKEKNIQYKNMFYRRPVWE